MASQGTADAANFFAKFMDGFVTGRGIKVAEEDRQRRIEREDYNFNRQLEADERQDQARDKIKEIYSMTSHSDEHKQKYLQTLETSKGINVPRTASGSYRAAEPTNLLTDPNYLRFTSNQIKFALGELLALDPNANITEIQKFTNSTDMNVSSMIVTGISAALYNNESMEDKSKMLQPLLGQMLNDKDIDVSVQKFTVANDRFDPNKPIAEDNQETKIVEKFVIKNSDGSIDRTVGMEDLANITDAVNLFAGAAENFASYSGAAKKLLAEERAIEKSDLDMTAAKLDIESKIMANMEADVRLKMLPDTLKAEIAEKLRKSGSDMQELYKTFSASTDKFSTNVGTAQKNLIRSYVEKGENSSLITGGLNTIENRKFFTTDKVESVISKITNQIHTDTRLVMANEFVSSDDKNITNSVNYLKDFSPSQIELITEDILKSIAQSRNSLEFAASLENKGTFGNIGNNTYFKIKDMYINKESLMKLFENKTVLRKEPPKETFGLK